MSRKTLYKAKRVSDDKWIVGYYVEQYGLKQIYLPNGVDSEFGFDAYHIWDGTLCRYTGLSDKYGNLIWENDIIQYNTYDDFDCQSVVKFGEYEQDGSGGEYNGRKCIGIYVEVDNFTCPDWCDNEPEWFPDYMWQQNILEVASECRVIGNIFDNPEIVIKKVL